VIKKLIQKHIEKLTIQDIHNFACKNGIHLKDYEANFIYKQIQDNWEEIIYHDHMPILKKAQNSLEKGTYEKALELITFFKNKYKRYL